MSKTLDNLLEEIFVMEPGMWSNDDGPSDWYAVGTDDLGIIAYFYNEDQAYYWRLDQINRALNPNSDL